MTMRSLRPLIAGLSLLVLAACAEAGPVGGAPPAGAAPIALDLGGSSRIRHIAGAAGEGEGYGTPRAPAAPEHASMPGMDHGSHAAPQPAATNANHAGMPGMGQSTAGTVQVAQAAHVEASGTVNSIDAAGHKVNLSHNPIPAIGWPAMTMDFSVAPSVNLTSIKPGSRVTFMMERSGDGMYVIHSIAPASGGR